MTIAWVALLNAVNPEAIVVRVNVARAVSARAVAGPGFDVAYHASLSADALPTLLAAAPQLSPSECEALGVALAAQWAAITEKRRAHEDWRGLDLPFARALAWSGRHALPLCGGRG